MQSFGQKLSGTKFLRSSSSLLLEALEALELIELDML